jgi:hypothetical protein
MAMLLLLLLLLLGQTAEDNLLACQHGSAASQLLNAALL